MPPHIGDGRTAVVMIATVSNAKKMTTIRRASLPLQKSVSLLFAGFVCLLWTSAYFELYRNRQNALQESQVRTAVQARVFGEYSRSTFRRINELILELRSAWTGDWHSFAELIKRKQYLVDDLTFQVAVIDKDGLLAFSNLAPASDRTNLNEREHFKVHKDAPESDRDRLFISKPLKGKVSGKWSIQLTRPIVHNGMFDGVVVVSMSPDLFAGFAKTLGVESDSEVAVVRDGGEIMARYPLLSDEGSWLGVHLNNQPYLEKQAPFSGNFIQKSGTDGVDRSFGFFRLPEYGMNFMVGESFSAVMSSTDSLRQALLLLVTAVTAFAAWLFFLLLRSLEAARQSRLQIQEIFNLSPDGLVSFDANRCVIYSNPSFTRMTGLQSSEVKGLDEVAFGDRISHLCAGHSGFPGVQHLINSHAVQSAPIPAQTGVRFRQIIEMTTPGNPVLEVGIRLSETTVVSQVMYFRDVTHETEVERLKSEFLSNAAHELRTPMASVYGFADLLVKREFPDAERKELLEIIRRQAGIVVNIIKELLDLVRIESRQGKDFRFGPVDVKKLVLEACAGFGVPEQREPPRLVLGGGEFSIRADQAKISQAFVNLLSNAYKYSGEGDEVTVSVEIDTTHASPGLIGIRVRDQGIGMTADHIQRLGERFFRADDTGTTPGVGLGMSIVKEIVQIHGGRMEFTSTPGEGSTATLWIPRAADSGAA